MSSYTEDQLRAQLRAKRCTVQTKKAPLPQNHDPTASNPWNASQANNDLQSNYSGLAPYPMIDDGTSNPYVDDSSLYQLQVNRTSRLGSSLAPMETDVPPQPENQPVVDDMEIDAARQRGDAYVDDTGLSEFRVNQVNQTSTTTPQPSTSQLSKQPVDENMGSDVAQQQDQGPDNVSERSIPTDIAPNLPQPSPSNAGSEPPAWVIRMGREFLVALNAQQAQDREVLENMQSSLKEVTQNIKTVTERLGTPEQPKETQRMTPRRNRKTSRRVIRNDYDGDSEDSPSSGRGPKTPKVNQFHEALRDYLREKNVLPKNGDPTPDPANPQTVDDFEQKHIGYGPDVKSVKMDWGKSMTSVWNSTALSVLAQDFLSLSETKDNFSDLRLDKAKVKRLCGMKLERTRTDYIKRVRQGKGEDELKKQVEARGVSSRKNTRRTGTFHRRVTMGEDCKYINPEEWGRFVDIVDMLGIAGMSSDETETEATRDNLKSVRRRQKDWRSSELSRFFESVDQMHKPHARGNKPYRRLPSKGDQEPTVTNAVRCLPINFYRTTWYWSLHQVDREELDAKEEMPLPNLASLGVPA